MINKRIACSRSDATLVILVSTHPDITINTPGGSPRVFDDVVQLTVGSIEADDQRAMIDLCGRACRFIVDARVVELKVRVRSVDENRDRTNDGNGVSQRRLALRLDVTKSLKHHRSM